MLLLVPLQAGMLDQTETLCHRGQKWLPIVLIGIPGKVSVKKTNSPKSINKWIHLLKQFYSITGHSTCPMENKDAIAWL